jgi:hypothetical protein
VSTLPRGRLRYRDQLRQVRSEPYGGGLNHVPFDPAGKPLRVTDRTTLFLCAIVVLFIFAVLVVNDESLFAWGFVIAVILALVAGLRES